jgi:hypothetical protein
VFEHPGAHLIQLLRPGYRTTWIRTVVDPAAEDEIVEVDTILPQQ